MKVSKQACPVDTVCRLVQDRAAFVLLRRLSEHPSRRFSELLDDVGGVSTRTLTLRLRELQACGMIDRTAYREAPPRVEYTLTPSGRAFRKVLNSMADWSKNNLPTTAQLRRAKA